MKILEKVEKSTDIGYLKILEQSVDIDIEMIKNESTEITDQTDTIIWWNKKRLETFTNLKNKIEKRLLELK